MGNHAALLEATYLAANIRKSQGRGNEMTVDPVVAQRKVPHKVLESAFLRNMKRVGYLWKLLEKMYLYRFLSKR